MTEHLDLYGAEEAKKLAEDQILQIINDLCEKTGCQVDKIRVMDNCYCLIFLNIVQKNP